MRIAISTTPSPKKRDSANANACVFAPKTRPIMLSRVNQIFVRPSSVCVISGRDSSNKAAAAIEITKHPKADDTNILPSFGKVVVGFNTPPINPMAAVSTAISHFAQSLIN